MVLVEWFSPWTAHIHRMAESTDSTSLVQRRLLYCQPSLTQQRIWGGGRGGKGREEVGSKSGIISLGRDIDFFGVM